MKYYSKQEGIPFPIKLFPDWIKKNAKKLVEEISPLNFNELVGNRKPIVIYFLNQTISDSSESVCSFFLIAYCLTLYLECSN